MTFHDLEIIHDLPDPRHPRHHALACLALAFIDHDTGQRNLSVIELYDDPLLRGLGIGPERGANVRLQREPGEPGE